MKVLAVTALSFVALNKSNVTRTAVYMLNKSVYSRVAVDIAEIVGGYYIAKPQDAGFIRDGIGAGLALDGFKDLVDAFVPDLS
jgi:hypothetical protein